jgi:hypothetical protein
VVGLIFLFWWNSESPEDVAADKDRAQRAHIVVKGKNMLRDYLKDGDSAKVSGVRGFAATGVACGTVNAKNGFGAYVGEQQFIVDTDSGQVFLESTAPQQILDSWPTPCR